MKALLIHFKTETAPAAVLALSSAAAHARRDPDVAERVVLAAAELNPGDDAEDLLERLYAERPQVALFYLDHLSFEKALGMADGLHKVLPAVKVLACGPDATWDAERLLRENPSLEAAVRGEAEEAFTELLRHYLGVGVTSLRAIAGITFRASEGAVVENKERDRRPELDELGTPHAAGPVWDPAASGFAFVETARGWAGTALFDPAGLQSGALASFSLGHVRADLERLAEAGVRRVRFLDAPFNLSPERANAILSMLVELQDRHARPFEVALELEPESLDEGGETVRLLSRLGRAWIDVRLNLTRTHGPRSAGDRLAGRHEAHRRQVERLAALPNARVALHLTYGLPGDDGAAFREWVDHAYSFEGCSVRWHPARLIKGTELYDAHREHGTAYNNRPPRLVLKSQGYAYEDVQQAARMAEVAHHCLAPARDEGEEALAVLPALARLGGLPPSALLERAASRLAAVTQRRRPTPSAIAGAFLAEVEEVLRGRLEGGEPELVARLRRRFERREEAA